MEILHHKHAVEYYKAIIPALVASCFSYLIFALIVHLGLGPIWDIPTYEYAGMYDYLFAILFALAGAFIGWMFIYCTKFCKMMFTKYTGPIYIKTAIGGILLGIIAFYFPLTRYFGHHEINELFLIDLDLRFLISLLIFKIVAIAITVTSGWRGGFIIPLFLLVRV